MSSPFEAGLEQCCVGTKGEGANKIATDRHSALGQAFVPGSDRGRVEKILRSSAQSCQICKCSQWTSRTLRSFTSPHKVSGTRRGPWSYDKYLQSVGLYQHALYLQDNKSWIAVCPSKMPRNALKQLDGSATHASVADYIEDLAVLCAVHCDEVQARDHEYFRE